MSRPALPRRVALFSKPNCPRSWGVLHEVARWAQLRELQVLIGADNGGWTGSGWSNAFCETVKQEADLAITIGGDGTLLGVARALFGWDKPLLGVNLGHLGYLTDIAASDIASALDAVVAGDYNIEERTLLQARVEGLDGTAFAFNDVVLSKGDFGRLTEFDVFVDGAPVYRLRADGLIVCTPTGSTAYALSANGPILHPALAAIALVPLCPHSLTARPITLPSSSRVEVIIRGDVPARLHCDGQAFGELLQRDTRIEVSQGATPARMLHLKGYSVFNTLREKLGWSSARA